MEKIFKIFYGIFLRRHLIQNHSHEKDFYNCRYSLLFCGFFPGTNQRKGNSTTTTSCSSIIYYTSSASIAIPSIIIKKTAGCKRSETGKTSRASETSYSSGKKIKENCCYLTGVYRRMVYYRGSQLNGMELLFTILNTS